MAHINNPIIRFTKEDAQRFHHPYDDALVVSIRVGDYNTYWVLVDNGSLLISSTTRLSSKWGLRGKGRFQLTHHLLDSKEQEYILLVWEDQLVAHECYIAMLEMDDRLQTICIEEQRMVPKPVEGLEGVLLDDSRPEWTTRIDTLASLLVCQALITFLREN